MVTSNRIRLRVHLAAVVLIVTSMFLPVASVALADCPAEQAVHCPAFSHTVRGHNYRPSHITMGLNGRPSCAYARNLIRTWLNHPTHRIYDSQSRAYWFEAARNPLEFTAGLCGYLKFRS
jgi:hypothetical protein